jgi:hypothetical protein
MLPSVHVTTARALPVRRTAFGVLTAAVAGLVSVTGVSPAVAHAGFFGPDPSGVAVRTAIAATRPAQANTEAAAVDNSVLPDPGTVLPRFSPVYMGSKWTMTEAEAVTIAQDFDVIAAQASVFPKYVTAMKAANPTLRIVAT